MRRYQDAFSPVPEETLRRVEDTLHHLPRGETRTVVRSRPRLAVALVLALLLTLCGGAVAADRLGVLDFLFRWDAPTEDQQRLVQNVNLTRQAELATITVTDAAFDGSQLSMGLLFDADQPTYAIAEGLWLNGALQSTPFHNLLNEWVSREQTTRQAVTGLSLTVDDLPAGPNEVKLRIMLLAPKQSVFVLDSNLDKETYAKLKQQAIDAGKTPVVGELSWNLTCPDNAYDRHLNDDPTYPHYRYSLLYAAECNMDIEEVWLTFTIDGAEEAPGEIRYWDVANNDDLPFTVVARRAEVTALGSHFMLDIYPKEGGIETARDLGTILPLAYRFYDEQREPLRFGHTSYSGGGGGWFQDEDGRVFFRIVDEPGVLRGMPEAIYLVNSSRLTNAAFWQWAIELRPADGPVQQAAFEAQSLAVSPGQELPFDIFEAEAVVENGMLMCVVDMSPKQGDSFGTLDSIWSSCGVYDLNRTRLSDKRRIRSVEETDDGWQSYMVTQYADLPQPVPDAVYIVPLSEGTNDPVWDWAILLPVARP